MTTTSRPARTTTAPTATRRRTLGTLLTAAGTGFVASLGLAVDTRARKKRTRKKPRCRKLGDTCTIGGKRTCCAGRTCSPVGLDNDPQTVCCLDRGAPCEQDRDCCGASICSAEFKLCFGVLSDRHAKANFGSVDPSDMLERVRSLPITTWNYRSDDAAVRHIGPMAQDFSATFGVGTDDRTIHPMDGQGVALAAIQGLAAQVAALQAEQQRLMAQIATLEVRGEATSHT